MAYRILSLPAVRGQLQDLPGKVRVRVAARIDGFAGNPRPPGCRKLEGTDDGYRVRVGDYRILYRVEDAAKTVLVVKVGHRRDVYRGR